MKRNDGVSTIAYNMNIEIDLKSLLSNCFYFMVPISILVTYIDGPHCMSKVLCKNLVHLVYAFGAKL